MLAAGNIDGNVILVDLSTLQPIMQFFSSQNNAISRIILNPNGKTLSSVDIDGSVLQWDIESRQQIGESFLVAEGAIDFSPNHATLASPQCGTNMDNGFNCLQSELVLWDLATGQQTGNRHKVSGGIYTLSPNGKIIVSVNCKQLPDNDGLFCRQEEILLWDAGTDQPIGQPLTSDIMFNISLAFSSDGRTLASAGCVSLYSTEGLGCAQNEIVIWNADTHKILGKALLESVTEIYKITFSPNNSILALSSNIGILLWDMKKQQLIGQPLVGPLDTSDTLAFNPDGTMLASGGCGVHANNNDCIQGEIILWDVATRQPIGQPLRGHTDTVSSVIFGSDGKSLWSGGYDKTILFWDLDIQFWIKHACEMAGRNFTSTEWSQYFSDDIYPSRQEDATCPQWLLEKLSEPELAFTPTLLPSSTPHSSDLPLPLVPTLTPLDPSIPLIDINTASLEEIESLPSISPTTAQKIIEYRDKNGPFQTVEDLLNVVGIGPSALEQIKDLITVSQKNK
jgi:competence ComEA-like helix-hairpin-helix protein